MFATRNRHAVPGARRTRVRLAGALVLAVLVGLPAVSHARRSSAQEWADSLRHVTVNGTELAYLDVGRGEPIVLVHGEISDYRAWLKALPELSKHYRVIAYSRRYHFPNQGGGTGTDYTRARQERDLAALVEALDLGSVHLVGHSYGGTLAASFAAHHPDRVRSLVLVEPSLADLMTGTAQESMFVADRRLMTAQARMALQDGFPSVGLERVVEWSFGEPGLYEIPRVVSGWMTQNVGALRMQFLSADSSPRLDRDTVGRISCPMLYVEGDRSPWHAHAMGDAFMSCRPAAHRVKLKRVGHGVPWDDPRGFDREVLEFLGRSRLASE